MKLTNKKNKRTTTSTSGGFSPYLYDLEKILDRLDIEITKAGEDEIKAHCPGHQARTGSQDRNPSWSINRDTGQHNCFSCGFSGNIVSLVCEVEGIDHWEAFKWLRSQGINLEAFELLREGRPPPSEEPLQLPEITLSRFTDPPSRVLGLRNLNRESIIHYGIKWDARTQGYVIPLHNREGEFIGYQLKSSRFVRNRPKEMKKSLTLFGLKQFVVGEPALLVESPLDVPRLYTAGFPNGLGYMGAFISDAQMSIILEITDKIIVATDNPAVDKSGWMESRRLKKEYSKRIQMYFFNYGKSRAKDPGEMADEQIKQAVAGAKHSVRTYY